MGAYENPQIVRDNKVGEIWAQTLANVSKSTTDFLKFTAQKKDKETERLQKILDKTTERALNRQTEVYDNLSKLKANPQIYDEVNKRLDKGGELYSQMIGTTDPALRKKLLNEIGENKSVINKLYNNLTSAQEQDKYFGETYNPTTFGKAGGVSKTQQGISKYVTGQSIRNGTLKGQQNMTFNDETKSWDVEFITEEGESFKQSANEFFGYQPVTIGDITKSTNATLLELGVTDKNGKIRDKFLGTEEIETITEGDKTYTRLKRNRNDAAIAELITPALVARAESYSEDPAQAQAQWDVIRQEGDPAEFDMTKFSMDAQSEIRQLFIQRYVEHAKDLVPEPAQKDASLSIAKPAKVDESKINQGEDIYNIYPDLETLKFTEPFRGKGAMMGPLNDQTKFDIDKFEKQATDMGFTVSTRTERRSADAFGTPEVTLKFQKTGKEVTISAEDDFNLVKAKMVQAAGDVRTIEEIRKEIIAKKIK